MGFMSRTGEDPQVQATLNEAATGEATLPQDIQRSDPRPSGGMFQTDALENMPIVSDGALDRMAFDRTQYPDAARRLQGYMQGHRWGVSYYQQLGGSSDVRTNISDYPNERNIINSAYTRILNFEITLTGPLQYTYDKTKGESNATGQALIYSRFTPYIGDFFVGAAGDNKLAMFRVSSVEPLSWRDDRVHEIGFYFYNYADYGNLQFLEQATKFKKVFRKGMYLSDTAVFLEEDYYKDLIELENFKEVLTRYYYSQFYDKSRNTLRHPNGRYDPYVVKYVSAKCDFDLTNLRPRQLYWDTDLTYEYTIWSRFQSKAVTTIADVWPYYINVYTSGRANNIMLTSLLNDPVITVAKVPNEDTGGTYVFSTAFYAGDVKNMSLLEALVYKTIQERQLTDSSMLLTTFLRNYLSLDAETAFYHIPIYLGLIDIAIPSIARRVPSTGF